MDTLIASASKYQPDPRDLRLMMGLIDLTSLEGKDTSADIGRLCEKAQRHSVAGVCVYPMLVRYARKHLGNSNIRLASVAGGFPGGQIPLHLKEEETKFAIAEGADEIDMVINRGKFLEQEYNYTADEIASLKSICGNTTLKVILETGELGSLEMVARAADIAIKAGADFVKTSTGKISTGATPEAVMVMMNEIKKAFVSTGKKTGIKPSGGIPDAKTAAMYYFLVREVLGNDWLQSSLFRFGASRLVDALSGEDVKTRSGGY